MSLQVKVEEFEVLPEDTYGATFVDIEECESANPAFAGRYWKWEFEILRDGEVPMRMTATSSAKLTRATKAGQWVTAIVGRQLDSGEEFDFATIEGKPCRLVLGIEDKENVQFNRVEKVMAPKPGQTRRPVPVSQAPDDAPF